MSWAHNESYHHRTSVMRCEQSINTPQDHGHRWARARALARQFRTSDPVRIRDYYYFIIFSIVVDNSRAGRAAANTTATAVAAAAGPRVRLFFTARRRGPAAIINLPFTTLDHGFLLCYYIILLFGLTPASAMFPCAASVSPSHDRAQL